MNEKLPDFLSLEQALERIGANYSASEVHGMACGMVALKRGIGVERWLKHVLPSEIDYGDEDYQETLLLLQQLFQATVTQLNDAELSLNLLLPLDEADLDERVVALQQWCQGVAFGVAASGIQTLNDLTADAREWFEDVVKIGSSGEFDLSDDHESEDAYLELVEFLRVGLLLMNEEMQPVIGMPLTEQERRH